MRRPAWRTSAMARRARSIAGYPHAALERRGTAGTSRLVNVGSGCENATATMCRRGDSDGTRADSDPMVCGARIGTMYRRLPPLLVIAVLHSGLTLAADPPWMARSKLGMVASDSPEALRIGADVLAGGGNAFDAAIATSLALSHRAVGSSPCDGPVSHALQQRAVSHRLEGASCCNYVLREGSAVFMEVPDDWSCLDCGSADWGHECGGPVGAARTSGRRGCRRAS